MKPKNLYKKNQNNILMESLHIKERKIGKNAVIEYPKPHVEAWEKNFSSNFEDNFQRIYSNLCTDECKSSCDNNPEKDKKLRALDRALIQCKERALFDNDPEIIEQCETIANFHRKRIERISKKE